MPDNTITVDYLIIGAGAMGMAFADVMVHESDYTIAIVDRNDAPGGHWTMSYPFVRLHGPSSFYGVNSKPMASDSLGGGANLASGHEILDYYDQVMRNTLLASGRVTYLPKHNLDAVDSSGQLTAQAHSLVTGKTTEIVVRRRVVDASYMNITVPAMGLRGFEVDEGVSVVPINEIVHLDGSYDRITVLGAGKTGLDACLWLLNRGVDPGQITWVVPRDAWYVNRDFDFPRLGSPASALADCRTADEVPLALERTTFVMRRDPDVAPTAFRCATVNPGELAKIRQIEHVVRLGRVRRIGTGSAHLDQGTIAARPGTVYVDCTSDGLAQRPLQPLFTDRAIILQVVLCCLLPPSAAIAARLECLDIDDRLRNDLCPPTINPVNADDLLTFYSNKAAMLSRWSRLPVLWEWFTSSRFVRGIMDMAPFDDPDHLRRMSELAAHLDGLLQEREVQPVG